MSTVKFGTLCDKCGAGSRNYAHDANACDTCGLDLCDDCANASGHRLVSDGEDGRPKTWDCAEAEA